MSDNGVVFVTGGAMGAPGGAGTVTDLSSGEMLDTIADGGEGGTHSIR